MAVETDPSSPNFGLETDQTSPNFGLAVQEPKQESVVGNALAGAGDVLKGFAQQFVPRFDLKTLAGLAYEPINAQIQGYNLLKSIVDTGKQVQEAEKTPPFSRERFAAGFNVAGQLGLLAAGGRAPKLAEIAGIEKPITPEATPQIPEPLVSEVAAQEPLTAIQEQGKIVNAETRNQNIIPAGAYQAEIGGAQAGGNIEATLRQRGIEAADAWQKAISKNDIEAAANAEAQLQRTMESAPRNSNVLDDLNSIRSAIRTQSISGENASPTIEALRARSSQEQQRIGQQIGEPTSDVGIGTQQISQQTQKGGEISNALSKSSAGEVLQRQPQEAGATRGERVGVEQGVQGQEAPQASTEEVAAVPPEQPVDIQSQVSKVLDAADAGENISGVPLIRERGPTSTLDAFDSLAALGGNKAALKSFADAGVPIPPEVDLRLSGEDLNYYRDLTQPKSTLEQANQLASEGKRFVVRYRKSDNKMEVFDTVNQTVELERTSRKAAESSAAKMNEYSLKDENYRPVKQPSPQTPEGGGQIQPVGEPKEGVGGVPQPEQPSPVSQVAESTTVEPKPKSEPLTAGVPQETGTGVSSERFREQYGEDAPVPNTGRSAKQFKELGDNRLANFQKTGDVKDDPYAVLTDLREGRVPVKQVPDDIALLRAEHKRLQNETRMAEGTDRWQEKSDAALAMANAIKEVAHGPASDTMRALQEYDKPTYDNVTDFDQALREREGRESTSQERVQFKKMADDVTNTRNGKEEAINGVQKRLGKMPKMNFEDAAKNIHDQITELTKNCNL